MPALSGSFESVAPACAANAQSFTAYAIAVVLGFWVDFRLTMVMMLPLQLNWTLFYVIRVIQLRHCGAKSSEC
jgi:hypothetical protein